MKELRLSKLLKNGVIAFGLCLTMGACSGSHGIAEPLNPVVQAPSVNTNPNQNFAVVRGNYFLLESQCPHTSSALRIAQDQDAVFIEDGFNFNNSSNVLVGFVDENALVRFFGDTNSDSANCTAVVENPNTEQAVILGSCSYADVIGTQTCRFSYGREVAGAYAQVWNDCQSNDLALNVQQSGNELTLVSGFDYSLEGFDEHQGVIEGGDILFNIDVLNPNQAASENFNCEANVSEEQLTGRCRDLTVDPASICTFGYENQDRIASVDLTDDSLFANPAVTPAPPSSITNIEGSYLLVSNDCANDGGLVTITQASTVLNLVGGFDYQTNTPDVYLGSVSSNSEFGFSVLGSVERAFCDSTLSFNANGVSGFSGTCRLVSSTTGADNGTCSYQYLRSN